MLILEESFTSAAVLTKHLGNVAGPITIAVVPGAGATIAGTLSMDNGRSFTAWLPGNVTADTNATTVTGQTPTHVRCTASVAATTCWLVVTI